MALCVAEMSEPTFSDGFALNVGLEDWQVDRVHDCYNAAQNTRLPFKLFISFDMTWVMTRLSSQNSFDADSPTLGLVNG